MTDKVNGIDEWVRGPPPAGPLWERAAKAIYNHEEKSFLGRTPKRWGILFTFYLVFYAVLALLSALCFGGLLLSLNEKMPTYTLDKSLIGANPGVAFRPIPYDEYMVRYRLDNSSHHDYYTEQLSTFFEAYSGEDWYKQQTECVAADNYGLPDTPCFFIKVNKIIGWQPEFYDASSLPADIPEDLKAEILSLEPAKQNQIWISCSEEDGNHTTLEYPWGPGLPDSFYPYLNSERYQSPIVALRITSTVRNQPIVIRCRAWAKNIIYNKSLKEPSGYTRFLLYIEDDTSAGTPHVPT